MKKFLLSIFILSVTINFGLCATNSNYHKNYNQHKTGQTQKWKDQERANMYEYGWDEPEYVKFRNEDDRKLYEREKWSNYEYSYDEDDDEF